MDTTSPTHSREIWLNILAVIIALIVVHNLGRFVFTPLMPYFIEDQVFNLAQGTDLASSNYLGYLIGALLAVVFSSPRYLKKVLILNFLLNISMTLLQCFVDDIHLMLLLRFLNGVGNGAVFVLAPALMLEWLHEHKKAHLSGYMYLGVSGGLVLTGILVSTTAPYFTGIDRWIPVAILSVFLSIFSLYRLIRLEVNFPQHSTSVASRTPLFDRRSTPLFFAYLGAGLGYILPMTFLPTLAYTIDATHELNPHIWTIVAIVCLIFTPIWNHVGSRYSDHVAVTLSFWLQGAGILAVLLLPSMVGVVLCAILVGSGFLGSVMCTQRYARQLQPHQGIKLSAVMIAIYAGAQLIAPILAKQWIATGGSLLMSFSLGLVAFIWGIICMYFIPKQERS